MKNQDSYPTWNDYLLGLQQEAPHPKPVKCRCKKVLGNRPEFYGDEYHGLISREEAERLCSEDGDFLIRESQTEPGRFALAMRIFENVKQYKLYYENGKHFVGEKRFDSVYSLVEDGLITMYIESKGGDYIETMTHQPVYNSLSRYSSLGSRLGAPGHSYYHHPGESIHVESLSCMKDSVETHQYDCDFLNIEESSKRPGYVPRTMLESGCYPQQISDVHFSQNVYSRHPTRGVPFDGKACGQIGPARWRMDRGPESNGGHKKMLTPTSSDERKRTKKRIATEDQILMRTTSNGEHGAHFSSSKHSPTKSNSQTRNTEPFYYQGVEDAKSDRFSRSQNLGQSSTQNQFSNDNHTSVESEFSKSCSARLFCDFPVSGKVKLQKSKIISNSPHRDFGHSQNLSHVKPTVHPTLEQLSDVQGVTYPEYHEKFYNQALCKGRPSEPFRPIVQRLNHVENIFQHEVDRTESFGSCESGMSNLSSVERTGTSSSRHTHDSHPNFSKDEFNLSGHHQALLRCSSCSPSQKVPGVQRSNSRIQEAKSPWRRRSDVEDPPRRDFSASFNCHLQPSSDCTSVFNSSRTNNDSEFKNMTKEMKRERRNSIDTSSLSRTRKIAIQPIGKPKPPLGRASSSAGQPVTQNKSKAKAILRRVSSFGFSKRSSPSSTPSRKGSIKEKSNKSKQADEAKNKSPVKFKKSNSVTSSPSRQSEITSPLHHQNSVTSPSNTNGEAQLIAQRYEKQHQYKSHTYKGLQWCEYCGNFMWGIIQQGVQCRDCGLNVHKQCSKLVPNDCQPALKHVKHVFGVDLTTLAKLHCTTRPLVVDMCIDEIEKKGMDSEGIYRVPGCHDDVMIVKAAFDQYGQDVNLSTEQDINTIAGVLKLYLRELPVPLVPYQLYSRFINAAKLTHDDGKLNAFRMGLNAMPEAHFQTLMHLIFHLGRVTENSVLNQMSANNLGVVFGPTLLRAPFTRCSDTMSINDTHYQQQIVETMIEYRHHLFL